MRCLLDINVLIALLDPDHTFHQRAHAWWRADTAWASCPLTENGVLRIMASRSYSNVSAFTVNGIARTFQTFADGTDHAFWGDTVSIVDPARFRHEDILSSRQLTDIYLLALAVENGGCLVTFDTRIPLSVVSPAREEHLVVL